MAEKPPPAPGAWHPTDAWNKAASSAGHGLHAVWVRRCRHLPGGGVDLNSEPQDDGAKCFSREEWAAFTAALRHGEFDDLS